MADKKKIPFLHVRIASPREVIFQGDATAVSSTNSHGKFDILPLHANFLTLVEGQPIIIRKAGGETVTFTFPMAIIYNRESHVDIYTDIQLSQEDLKR